VAGFGKKSVSSKGQSGGEQAAQGATQNPSKAPVQASGAQNNATKSEGHMAFNNASSAVSSVQAGAPIVSYRNTTLDTADYRRAKQELMEELLDSVDFQAIEMLPEKKRAERIIEACDQLLVNMKMPLNASQLELLKEQAVDEILGFGPIQILLNDPNVNDIMINTAKKVFIEREGKIFLTDLQFNNEAHLLGIIQRVVSRVGRRIDESSPMVDARMPDGSRFNAIIQPLALDGGLVSIRKFKQSKMLLDQYIGYNSLTQNMADFLKICARIRLNIIISGGTGSGKTTLLNALSANTDPAERIITIEDAAELQLKQPHVLRLETRPPSTEGKGEVTQRQLVRNALRMRPDRIILGEIRGDEVIDVLSAMNTGHDGSMATIHANSPRDCLARLENLVAMSAVNIQSDSLRQQIASAVHLIVQIQRMSDGKRRIVQIEEIQGIESGGIILTQTLFEFKIQGVNADGTLEGKFIANPYRPKFLPMAEHFGLVDELLACFPTPSSQAGAQRDA
jgi:pilus assembly protein CpaF